MYNLEHPAITRAMATGYGSRFDEPREEYCACCGRYIEGPIVFFADEAYCESCFYGEEEYDG